MTKIVRIVLAESLCSPVPSRRSIGLLPLRTFASESLSQVQAAEAGASGTESTATTSQADPPTPISQSEHVKQGEYTDVETTVYNLNREPVGSAVLPGDVFDVPIRKDILHRVVRWQLAARQQGTHKTKTRAEVRGGGRKPWQQKGSGRARQGSIRAPQFRGGGIVHGPVPRSHAHKLQKRVRRLGLKCALSAKAWERRLFILDSIKPVNHKSKTMMGHLTALSTGAPRISMLMIDSSKDGDDGGTNCRLGARNLIGVDVLPAARINVYSILRRDHLVLTKDALNLIIERMRRPIKPCSMTP